MSLGVIPDHPKLNRRCNASALEGISVSLEDYCRLAANGNTNSVGIFREIHLGSTVQLLSNAQCLRDEGEGQLHTPIKSGLMDVGNNRWLR